MGVANEKRAVRGIRLRLRVILGIRRQGDPKTNGESYKQKKEVSKGTEYLVP